MAKKQTRRSVSIRGTTYEKIRNYCEKRGQSMSEFVEELVAQFFESGAKVGVQRPAKVAAPRPAVERKSQEKLDDDEMHDAARHFTF